MRGQTVNYFDQNEVYRSIDPSTLPSNMLLQIDADVGENSNSNIVKKMTMVGQQLLPALQAAGAGGVISPDAAVKIAAKTIEAMDLDPLDYLEDYTSEDFKKKAQASKDNEMKAAEKLRQLEEQVKQLNIAQQQATIDLTNVQSKNSMQDNIKQLMVALDKSSQEWAKLYISAAKEGVELPPKPDINELLGIATKAIQLDIANDASRPANGVELTPQQGPAAAMPDQMM
jgi:ATP-dependent protease HslVU (ClpYQ) ATPase subunit